MSSFTIALVNGRTRGAVMALLLAAGAARAQAPAWQSAFGPTSSNNFHSEVKASTTDAAGNVYLVGDFGGSIQLGATTLVSAGGDNAFVAKWSLASRTFVWAQRLGGTADDFARAVAVSGNSVYVGGFFRSPSLVVGSTTLLNTSGSNNNFSDGFVVKLLDAGTSASFGWAQQLGGTASDDIYALAAAGSSVYVAGSFSSATAQFAGAAFANVGSSDVFVARLTDAGASSSLAWAQRAGGPGFDQTAALAVSGGNVYVAGTFEQTATFGSTALTSSGGGQGGPDVFVAKLADVGTAPGFTWAVRGGAASSTYARGLAASGSSVYLVGDFSGLTATFGSTVLANAGGFAPGNDAFIAKLTDAGASGTFGWALAGGGASYDEATAVAVRGSSVYVTGHFSSATAAFGPTTLPNANTNPNQVNGYDVFVARLRDAGPTGSFVWATAGGSSVDSDYARAVALGGTTVYVTGSVHPPATFGSQVLNVPGSTSTNPNPAAFVATLTDATGLATATAAAAGLPAFGLFPNPAHGTATVQLPAGLGPTTLTVLDALGRPVRTQAAPGPRATLDLAGLPAGLYAVCVAAGGATATQRLMVE